jgi:hypothetical protein
LSRRINPILVEIPRRKEDVPPEARRRIREAARRSNGAVKYERNYLVVENNSLGLRVLVGILKDLGGVERLLAYWLETIPFNKLEERLKKEEELNRYAGIKRLGKNVKDRLAGVADLGPLERES